MSSACRDRAAARGPGPGAAPGPRDRRVWLIAALLVAAGAGACARADPAATPPAVAASDTLRVCADPNNLPFSNERGEGFENAIAEVVARELERRVRYTWWPQRRGFVRNTLDAGSCDVVMGVPAGYELTSTTAPYYTSTYVAVTRQTGPARLASLDDPRLRRLAIGLHIVGDDYAHVPPGAALVARGIVNNVRGYSLYGDYSQPDPPADLIRAVGRGDIDVAFAWGPLGGYFAAHASPPLRVTPLEPVVEAPMTFAIAMGVRRGDEDLRRALERAIARRAGDLRLILEQFGVPLVDGPTEHAARRTP
jgi:quinoprotein dehydrogenase-associated probable ABC transporter substrate-binding protein